jgi:hypothetical protein
VSLFFVSRVTVTIVLALLIDTGCVVYPSRVLGNSCRSSVHQPILSALACTRCSRFSVQPKRVQRSATLLCVIYCLPVAHTCTVRILTTCTRALMVVCCRLLEVGFAAELDTIIRACPRSRQTMLFSATMTDAVEDLVKLSLHEPVRAPLSISRPIQLLLL